MEENKRDRADVIEIRELVINHSPPEVPVDERDKDRVYYASQWQLMRRRFFKHKVAVGSLMVLILMYFTALFAPFLSPLYNPWAIGSPNMIITTFSRTAK